MADALLPSPGEGYDPRTDPNNVKNWTLSGILRGAGERAGQIFGANPFTGPMAREVVANWKDIARIPVDWLGLPDPARDEGYEQTRAHGAIQRMRQGLPPAPDSVSEAPFGTHSSDPAVSGAAMVADPTNLIGGAAVSAPVKLARGAASKLLTGAERVAPKLFKPRVVPPIPRFDPGSPQQLIPGLDPLSLEEAHNRAIDQLAKAERGMHFEDMNRGLRFQYDPDWRGSAFGASEMQPGAWDFGFIDPHGDRGVGKRQVNNIREGYLFRRDLEEQRASPMVDTSGDLISGRSTRAQVGPENFQEMLERLARLRAAEQEATARGEEFALTRSREMNDRIRRNRALLSDPNITPQETLRLQEDILSAKRQRPFEVDDERVRMAIPHPDPHANLHGAIDWRDLHGRGLELSHEELAPLMEQSALVRRLRGEPEPTPARAVRRPPERGPVASLPEVEGRDPNAMSREAVNAFLAQAQTNPELFQHGALMPPPNVRSLEDFADYFGKKSGMDINVDWQFAENPDEPYKIKQKKEHGRGEVMRDRYGDYMSREKEHSRGDYPMYDEYGDVKKVEAPGPMPEGSEGPLMIKRVAEGGEPKRDYRGDPKYEYKKSEGGEPMRDERGRIKYEEVENPDYQSGGEYDQAEISSPHGHITVDYGDPATIVATQAGKKGGQTLYQVALAHAAREGLQIGGGGLTDINAYRLLGNTLSNIARSGVNPRDLAGTQAGLAQRARGFAKGPEVWRADAEEGRARLLAGGADPDRVTFDPEKGYHIDGKPATPDDIKVKLNELSPLAGQRGSHGGVGQKSLMRNAVFEWLRNADPREAKAVAEKWPKEWGPIFAGVGAATVLGGMLQGQQEKTD